MATKKTEKEKMEVSLRLATLADMSKLMEIEQGVEWDLGDRGVSHWYGGNDKEEFTEAIKGDNSGCVVAENQENSQIIGYLVYNNHNEEKLKEFFPDHKSGSGLCLDGTGVLPACKRSGVFAQMYDWLDEYAEKYGYSTFFGTVDPTNAPSIMSSIISAIVHGGSIKFVGPVIVYHMKDGRKLERCFLRIEREKRSFTEIGVFTTDIEQGLFAQNYDMLDEYAEKYGYSTFFGTVDPTNVSRMLELIVFVLFHCESIEFSGPHIKDGRDLKQIFVRIKRAKRN